MTETSRQFLSKQLARVIAINLICLALFIAFCTFMTFGSPSLLLSYWNGHRAASVVVIMISIVSIPGLVELTASQLDSGNASCSEPPRAWRGYLE